MWRKNISLERFNVHDDIVSLKERILLRRKSIVEETREY